MPHPRRFFISLRRPAGDDIAPAGKVNLCPVGFYQPGSPGGRPIISPQAGTVAVGRVLRRIRLWTLQQPQAPARQVRPGLALLLWMRVILGQGSEGRNGGFVQLAQRRDVDLRKLAALPLV